MTTKFSAFSTHGTAFLPYLPVAHTTDWETMISLVEGVPVLKATLCPVYAENLLYLFYGRPCFRKHSNVEPISLKSFDLVCFLVDPISIPSPKRVLPFDSGAFANNIYRGHLHPSMKLADFEIDPSLESIAKFIDVFFSSNDSYFSEKLKPSVTHSPRDTQVESYLSIVRATSATPYDDRRSAIEMQIDIDLDLTSSRVLAVIAPEEQFDDNMTLDFVQSVLRAEPIGYFSPHARPIEDARSIVQAARDFYIRRGIL